jgi:predicted ATPase with chaperone activity
MRCQLGWLTLRGKYITHSLSGILPKMSIEELLAVSHIYGVADNPCAAL